VVQHAEAGTALRLYVRKSTGMAKCLRADGHFLAFVEGPYPNDSIRDPLRRDCLLPIGNGIGITGLLPFASNHRNAKLAWSIKESARCLINDLKGALSCIADKQVKIGTRLDINQLLEDEIKAVYLAAIDDSNH